MRVCQAWHTLVFCRGFAFLGYPRHLSYPSYSRCSSYPRMPRITRNNGFWGTALTFLGILDGP